MKFLIDEAPAYPDECPFYCFSEPECSLDRVHCNYFDKPFRERTLVDCRFLVLAKKEKALSAHAAKQRE